MSFQPLFAHYTENKVKTTIWLFYIFKYAKSPMSSSKGWETLEKVITWTDSLCSVATIGTLHEHAFHAWTVQGRNARCFHLSLWSFFFRERSSSGHVRFFHRHNLYFIKARGKKIIRSKYTMSIFYFSRR